MQERRAAEALRLMVVEDQAMIAMLLGDMLEALGHEVAFTATGLDEALAAIEGAGFDAAVLDANLDGLSSAPVAEELRRRGIPYVVASGYSIEELRRLGFRDAAVVKPYRQAELQAALEAALRGER
jgi:CheY-like chemotaxis protein